jgi:anti-anti-sigma factor
MAHQNSHQPTAPAVEVDFRQPGIALVKLRGEHDLSKEQVLTEALADASDQLNVLVDLSECTFIDSSVIAVLFVACEKLNERGGRIELVIPPEASTVHRVATLTGLPALLRVHETQAAGIASFQPAEHSIQVKDRRLRFGDPDACAAQCSCGWSGETHTGRTAGRLARRDGRQHVDEERLAPSSRPKA